MSWHDHFATNIVSGTVITWLPYKHGDLSIKMAKQLFLHRDHGSFFGLKINPVEAMNVCWQ